MRLCVRGSVHPCVCCVFTRVKGWLHPRVRVRRRVGLVEYFSDRASDYAGYGMSSDDQCAK
eukprot:15437491-Alexandrium_andersonii.AAC.1